MNKATIKHTYNDSWILSNWEESRNWVKLTEEYNKVFGTEVTYAALKYHCIKVLGLRLQEVHIYEYDDSWILTNWEDYRNWSNLCKSYNALFGTNINYHTFKSHCNRELGLNFVYSEEEISWLRENYPKLGKYECAVEFNKVFNTNRTVNGVTEKCKKLGIHVSNERKRETVIKNTGNYHEPGTILDKGRGYLFIKRTDGKWVQLQRYLTGVDDGCEDVAVIFLDGNKRNFEPENLVTIPRKYLGPMTKNKFWSEFPEVTKTGLIWCELREVLGKDA